MWFSLLMPIAVNVPIFVTMALVFRAMRRIKGAYTASGGRLCTHCEHDLRDLGDIGTCPECGHAFDIERDRLAWKRAGIF